MVERAIAGDQASRKAALRQHILARRDALTSGYRASASDAAIAGICDMPVYRNSETVLAYFGFGTEIDTRAFLAHTLKTGKTLLLPRVDRSSRSLKLYRVADLDRDLEAGVWGIREPVRDRCTEADPRSIDFALMPGVAFTRTGGRLGYGGGFYDRLIPQMTKPPAKIAPAFCCQVVDSLPMTENDQYIDAVICEEPANDRAVAAQSSDTPGKC